MVGDFVRVVGAVGLCNMKPRLLLARCIHMARDSSRDDAFPIQVMLAALLHAAFQKKINCNRLADGGEFDAQNPGRYYYFTSSALKQLA